MPLFGALLKADCHGPGVGGVREKEKECECQEGVPNSMLLVHDL